MARKSIKGLIKTRHFKQRQKERNVSDLEIVKAITQGSLIENDLGQNFTLGSLKVTVDLTNDLLITVHPGDPSTQKSKILDKETAKNIRALIDAKRAIASEEKSDQDEFLQYVNDFAVKKI